MKRLKYPITKLGGFNHKNIYNLKVNLILMIDIEEKKEKMILFLKSSGPSLPVRIAKTIDMDPVFASAILSELLNTKQVKMSHLKVGSSSLYLLPGQEKRLEEHANNLKSAEKEAYLDLKERGTLIDEECDPIIRVALRNLKDFAIPFRLNEKIMWKYSFAEEEIILEKPIKKAWENKVMKKEIPRSEKRLERKIEEIFIEKKQSPEFLKEIRDFLGGKNIDFLEEIKTEKKEIIAKINIKTTIGDINFLLIAKNKMIITKEEINSAIQQSIYNNMPCLIIIRKEPPIKIQKIFEENHLIQLEIMKK